MVTLLRYGKGSSPVGAVRPFALLIALCGSGATGAGCSDVRFSLQRSDAGGTSDGPRLEAQLPYDTGPEAPREAPDVAAEASDTSVADTPTAEAADAPVDPASPDMPPCTLGPFGAPLRVDLMLPPMLWGPSLSSDGLTLYFARSGGSLTSEDIWMATRANPTSPFGGAVGVAGVNGAQVDATPFISLDGLTLYFASDRAGGTGNRDIWYATRASPSASFTTSSNLAVVNSSAIDHLPSLTSDQLTLFFSSGRPGGAGGVDIWMATRTSMSAPFTTPVNVTELNSTSEDSGTSISADGLTIYFESDRPSGNEDLWFSTRTSVTAPFSAPARLPNVNSDSGEQDPVVSRDGRELFFSSDRGGQQELWRATRSCM